MSDQIVPLTPAHISVRHEPRNLSAKDRSLFQHEFSASIPGVHIRIKRHAVLFRGGVLELWGDTYRSYTSLRQHRTKLDRRIKNLLRFWSLKSTRIEKAVWIFDEWSQNYFHWFTDALPRLMACEERTNDHVVLLPEPWTRFGYIQDSLKLLGYKAVFSSAPVVVGELMLPSHTAPTGNYNQTFLDRVRDRLLAASPSNASAPARKIYISRKHATSRAVENEDEILPLLSEYGFEVHHMESYSLAEQISLMSQTKYLLGPHGAGLTNMLFMPAESSVLEIRARGDAHNNCYFSLASAIRHRYYYVLADARVEGPVTSFRVDAAALRSVLSKMMGAPVSA